MHVRHASSNVKNEWFDMTVDEVINFKNECKHCEDLIKPLLNNPFF